MLNPFPIQFLAPLAYVLLRLVVGVILVSKGARMLRETDRGTVSWFSGLTQILIGIMYIIGLYTQIATLGSSFLALSALIPSLKTLGLTRFNRSAAVLLLAISLALFITGAGPFAFDLPI